MAVRAADRVTLAVLPAPSYVRTYYLMQESTLSAPAKPTTNPPAAPWTTAEPAYMAGSTLTLYTAMVTVYGSVSFDWGDVQKSSSYEAAKQAYNLAAANATTIDGMRRLIASVAEPTAPAGGWMNGDQWWQYEVEPVTGRNRLSNIWVWNGTTFVPFQIVADSLLIPGSVGNILLADGAIDAMTITGAQIYGGYIEAPVIASSDKLGTGANVLNDPEFMSTIDTDWVASGHLGDTASKSQVDTISWDRTWTQQEYVYPSMVARTMRNYANIVATATYSPGTTRYVGTVLFPNLSWVNTTPRTITNPHTFENKDWLQLYPLQEGGASDPSFGKLPAAPDPVAGTARTTYLTNSSTPSIVAGERWNARIGFTPISAGFAPYVTGWAEVVNASTLAVLWSHELTSEELLAGRVNAWWDSTYTGSVKFRVKFTYTAGGHTLFVRRPASGNYARQTKNGSQVAAWERSATSVLQYGGAPGSVDVGSFMPAPTSALRTQIRLTSALFAKVEPEKGWRLTEESGLELFNALGAKTGQLDGEDNFLAGTFATAESGARAQLNGTSLGFHNSSDVLVGSLSLAGSKLSFSAPVTFQGDTAWGKIDTLGIATLGSGFAHETDPYYGGLWARIKGGVLYVTGRLIRASFAGNATLFTLNSAYRPGKPVVQYAYTGGANFAVAQPDGVTIIALAGTTGATLGFSWPLE